jgi:hypothetical protein
MCHDGRVFVASGGKADCSVNKRVVDLRKSTGRKKKPSYGFASDIGQAMMGLQQPAKSS